jgi:hypothetical protein
MQELIQIQSVAKRNGLFLVLVGSLGIMLSLAMFNWLPKHFYLAGIFVTSASLVTLLLAWFKLREPPFSIELSRQELSYKHRQGQWRLSWDNIQRVDIPRVYRGLELQNLHMVGIKIKNYEPLLDAISLRLVSNILMEQRPLLIHGHQQGCNSGNCYSNDLLEDDNYKTSNGKVYTGLKAMLAHRMTKLRSSLGYDLYIANAELDRPTEDFVALLRQCQRQVQLTADVSPRVY